MQLSLVHMLFCIAATTGLDWVTFTSVICHSHMFFTFHNSGEFGDVYKGTLRKPGEKERIVAVKTLKVW